LRHSAGHAGRLLEGLDAGALDGHGVSPDPSGLEATRRDQLVDALAAYTELCRGLDDQ
jgi:hypothetical protein